MYVMFTRYYVLTSAVLGFQFPNPKRYIKTENKSFIITISIHVLNQSMIYEEIHSVH